MSNNKDNQQRRKIEYAIFDKERNKLWDEDGETLLFPNEIAARNFIFMEGYKEEWMNENIEFVPMMDA